MFARHAPVTFEVNAKCSWEPDKRITITETTTAWDFKQCVATMSTIPVRPEELRLIFAGFLVQDHEVLMERELERTSSVLVQCLRLARAAHTPAAAKGAVPAAAAAGAPPAPAHASEVPDERASSTAVERSGGSGGAAETDAAAGATTPGRPVTLLMFLFDNAACVQMRIDPNVELLEAKRHVHDHLRLTAAERRTIPIEQLRLLYETEVDGEARTVEVLDDHTLCGLGCNGGYATMQVERVMARPTLLDYVSLRANCRFCATPNSVLVPRPFCAQRACGHEGVEVMEGSALTSWQQLLQLRALCHHCNTTGRPKVKFICEANGRRCVSHTERLPVYEFSGSTVADLHAFWDGALGHP